MIFDTKISLPAIETSIISGLDITLAAPRKSSFDSLEKRRKRLRKRQPTLNTKTTIVSAIAPAETTVL